MTDMLFDPTVDAVEANPFSWGDTSADSLRQSQIEPPDSWLANFILPGTLTLVHAAPGTGKTPFTMQLCNAAMGYNNLFNWRKDISHKAESCYYMDGELPLHLLKRNLLANFHKDANPMFFSAAKWYKDGNSGLDLGDQFFQDALRRHLDKIKPDILVLDNRSNFFKGEENSNDDAIRFNTFLIELRERGVAIIINHHQGKMGQSRGASAIQDVMDTVIRLDRIVPAEEVALPNFKFNIAFEKARMGWLPPRGIIAKIGLTGDIQMFDNDVYKTT